MGEDLMLAIDLTIILRIKDGAVGVTGWGMFILFFFFFSLSCIVTELQHIRDELKKK